jgi:hypothetical protein
MKSSGKTVPLYHLKNKRSPTAKTSMMFPGLQREWARWISFVSGLRGVQI